MTEQEATEAFVVLIRRDLPVFAVRTDSLMLYRGMDREDILEMPHIWLEAAADITNEDIAAGNEAEVVSQVQYIAEALRKGDPMLCKALVCSYVENLMWNIKDSASRRWAWKAFPEIIRQYYERMWGPVRF